MEIKITCSCGARYQFPVEPVDGRLPRPIACPVCGADNTDAGNLVIQQQLSAIPVATASPAGHAKPSGYRVTAAETPSRPIAPPATPIRPPSAAPRRQSLETFKKVGATILTVALVLIGCYALYNKWAKRVGGVASLIGAVTSSDDESSGSDLHWTLPADDGAVLLVKCANHTNVAQQLAVAYQQIVKQPMAVTVAADEFDESGSLAVYPPIEGAVEVFGPWEWPEPQANALASAVSQKLNSLIVMAIMGDDAETGVVSIFENGERKFRLKRWYQITSLTEDGIKEFMEREGEEWASQHGYVPSPEKVLTGDSDEMPFEDVNAMLLKMGIDVSETPDEVKNVLLLKRGAQ